MRELVLALVCVVAAYGQLPKPAGGGGSGTVNSGTLGFFPRYTGTGTTIGPSSVLFEDIANERIGIKTSTPGAPLDVNGNVYFRSSLFVDVINPYGTSVNIRGAFYIPNSLSIGLGLSNTAPTGTVHVYDATPTTGVTKDTHREGAGQSTQPIFVIQDSAGANPVGFHRVSSRMFGINDGTSTANWGDLKFRELIATTGTEGTCDSTNRGRVVFIAGGAGVADTWRICRKDAADAYAFAALF